MWGRRSDRRGPRGVLLVGLLGFGVTMLVFSFVESLAAVYAERFLSGMFAAAVTPVAAAAIGNFTAIEQGRARRLAFVSMAGIAGFLLGPMLGVFVTRFAGGFLHARPAGRIGRDSARGDRAARVSRGLRRRICGADWRGPRSVAEDYGRPGR